MSTRPGAWQAASHLTLLRLTKDIILDCEANMLSTFAIFLDITVCTKIFREGQQLCRARAGCLMKNWQSDLYMPAQSYLLNSSAGQGCPDSVQIEVDKVGSRVMHVHTCLVTNDKENCCQCLVSQSGLSTNVAIIKKLMELSRQCHSVHLVLERLQLFLVQSRSHVMSISQSAQGGLVYMSTSGQLLNASPENCQRWEWACRVLSSGRDQPSVSKGLHCTVVDVRVSQIDNYLPYIFDMLLAKPFVHMMECSVL